MLFMKAAMPTALTRKPFSGVLGEAAPRKGVLFLRTQGVLGEREVVHGRYQACSTCSEAFAGGAREAIYEKYHQWHSAAQPLKPCLPWGVTCTLGVCLGKHTEAAREAPPSSSVSPVPSAGKASQLAKDECFQVQLHYHRADKKKVRFGAERQRRSS